MAEYAGLEIRIGGNTTKLTNMSFISRDTLQIELMEWTLSRPSSCRREKA